MNDAEARPPFLGRWLGWRLRGLVAVALAACLAIFALMRWLAESPHLALHWQADARGQVTVRDAAGDLRVLRALALPDGALPVSAELLALSPRWLVEPSRQAGALALQELIASAPRYGSVQLVFDDGSQQRAPLVPRGLAGLGWSFWPLASLALAVLLVGAVVALARPHAANLLYLAITLCQFASLLLLAASLAPGLGLPAPLPALDGPLRASLDLIVAATSVHALAVYPQRAARTPLWPLCAWAIALLLIAMLWNARLPWIGLHLALLLLGAMSWIVVRQAQQRSPHPVLKLIEQVVAGGWIIAVLTTAAFFVSSRGADPGPQVRLATLVTALLAWSLLPALLLLAPLAMRSRQALREFALLAGVSTVAAALDLLFITVFSLSAFASLTLVVFVSLAVYAWARQWLFDRLLASHALTTERIFDQLYRAAREVQARPGRHAVQLAALLRDLFEPLEIVPSQRQLQRSRVAGGGSSLLVPVLALSEGDHGMPAPAAPSTLMLRFARRGRRIFTREDARLADRVVEQLRRAVAYDLAVERGRAEERTRIAQDLHDDIGARLLTLMYQAPNAEMEDYVRHTLKDLKTLTRGLAAGEHRWSHALGEWKADLAQRLAAARIELDWHADYDEDLWLGVVQWSALTRVLRELISNTIHHAQPTQVTVRLVLCARRLELSVADNGQGGDPQAWSQGLGLGGVKKRVKLLGGEVQWGANMPRGIVCEVRIPELAAKA